MIKKYIFVWLCFLFSWQLQAKSLYPIRLSLRPFGLYQGKSRSCTVLATLSAYEHAFQSQYLPIKLSLFYFHSAYARHNLSREQHEVIGARLDNNDEQFIDKHGYFLPAYMWPEDMECINEEYSRLIRPQVSLLDYIPVQFSMSMSNGSSDYTFRPGYGNSVDLNDIKKFLERGDVLTLDINGNFIASFDRKLGLIEKGVIGKASKRLFKGVTHSLAVVGYDDDLYGDYNLKYGGGALIVHNSWNSDYEKNLVKEPRNAIEQKKFELFRAKIYRDNLPGYFALPYHFLFELINQNATFGKIALHAHSRPNFKEAYNAYKKHEGQFETYYLPYTCDSDLGKRALLRYARLKKEQHRNKEAEEELKKLLAFQVNYPKTAYFSLAKFTRLEDIYKFYSGDKQVSGFYCGDASVYPAINFLKETTVYFQLEMGTGFNGDFRQENTWDRFFSELLSAEFPSVHRNPHSENSLFMAPYSCHMQEAKEQLEYFQVLVEELGYGDATTREFAQKEIDNMLVELSRNLKKTNFNIAYLTSKSQVRSFYHDPVFKEAYCKGATMFPSHDEIKYTEFFRNIIDRVNQDYQTKDYWKRFFDAFSR